MAIKKQKADPRELIIKKLEEEERTLAWLSRKTGIPYGTLYTCFVHKVYQVSEDNLIKINTALGTDFSL
jgi:hypothetical protein